MVLNASYPCGGCGRAVDPGVADTLVARRQVRMPSLGSAADDYMDGEGVLFHSRCWPGDSATLKRRDEPPPSAAGS